MCVFLKLESCNPSKRNSVAGLRVCVGVYACVKVWEMSASDPPVCPFRLGRIV